MDAATRERVLALAGIVTPRLEYRDEPVEEDLDADELDERKFDPSQPRDRRGRWSLTAAVIAALKAQGGTQGHAQFDGGREFDWSVYDPKTDTHEFDISDGTNGVRFNLDTDQMEQLFSALTVTRLRDAHPDGHPQPNVAALAALGHSDHYIPNPDEDGSYIDWSTRTANGDYGFGVENDGESVEFDLSPAEMDKLIASLALSTQTEAAVEATRSWLDLGHDESEENEEDLDDEADSEPARSATDRDRLIRLLPAHESRMTQSDNTSTVGGKSQDPAKHPHVASGPKGGQFTSKGGGGSKPAPKAKAAPKAAGASSVPQAPATPRTMKPGDSGEDVRYAQYAMSLLGFNVNQNGSYDAQTAAAVKEIQSRLGMAKPNGHLSASQLHKLQDAVRLSPCVGQSRSFGQDLGETRDLGDIEARHRELVLLGIPVLPLPPDDDNTIDDDTRSILDALAEWIERQVDEDWDERAHDVSKELRIPGGKGGGRWTANPIGKAISDALEAWGKGQGPDDPFVFDGKPIDREPLRRAAVARGITLKRGASRDDIVHALLGGVREEVKTQRAERQKRLGSAKFSINGPDGKKIDVAVYTGADPNAPTLREITSANRPGRVITTQPDLAGLEKWANDNGHTDVADWAASERARVEAKSAPKAPAKTAKKAGAKSVPTAGAGGDVEALAAGLGGRDAFAHGGGNYIDEAQHDLDSGMSPSGVADRLLEHQRQIAEAGPFDSQGHLPPEREDLARRLNMLALKVRQTDPAKQKRDAAEAAAVRRFGEIETSAGTGFRWSTVRAEAAATDARQSWLRGDDSAEIVNLLRQRADELDRLGINGALVHDQTDMTGVLEHDQRTRDRAAIEDAKALHRLADAIEQAGPRSGGRTRAPAKKAATKAAKAAPKAPAAPKLTAADRAQAAKIASALQAAWAKKFHEDWHKAGKTGTPERPKPTKDKAWIAAHGTDTVDIANTQYEDLPDDWQKENRDAAEVVQRILKARGGTVDLNDEKTRLAVGEEIHQAWLDRHGDEKWEGENGPTVREGELGKPFADLPRGEQDKDTDQLKVAMGALAPAAKKATPAKRTASGGRNKTTKDGIPIGPQDRTTSAGPGKLILLSGREHELQPGDRLTPSPQRWGNNRYSVNLETADGRDMHVEQDMTYDQAVARIAELNDHLGRNPAAPKAPAKAAKAAAKKATPSAPRTERTDSERFTGPGKKALPPSKSASPRAQAVATDPSLTDGEKRSRLKAMGLTPGQVDALVPPAGGARPKGEGRAAELTAARHTSDVVAEVHELVGNGATPAAIRHRLTVESQRTGVDTTHLQALADDPKALQAAADKMAEDAGLRRVGDVGAKPVPFDRKAHTLVGPDVESGSSVKVVRPSHVATLSSGEQVSMGPAKVRPVESKREPKAPKAAGSVPATGVELSPSSYAARQDALRSLHAETPVDIRQLGGGYSGQTNVETHADGQKVVTKVYDRGADRAELVRQSDAEELGGRIMAAVGLGPAVVRTGDTELAMEWIDGKVGTEVIPVGGYDIPADLIASDSGRLMGLAGVIMGDVDGENTGNWIVTADGRVVGIDHGLAFNLVDRPDRHTSAVEREMAGTSSSFARYMAQMVDGRMTWNESIDISPSDIAVIRGRLEALRPEFEQRHRLSWYQDALHSLDVVAGRASGTRSVLGP